MENSLVVVPVKEIRGFAKFRGNIVHYPDALRGKCGRESQDNSVNNLAVFHIGKHVYSAFRCEKKNVATTKNTPSLSRI